MLCTSHALSWPYLVDFCRIRLLVCRLASFSKRTLSSSTACALASRHALLLASSSSSALCSGAGRE